MTSWVPINRIRSLYQFLRPQPEEAALEDEPRRTITRLIKNHIKKTSLVCLALTCPVFRNEYFAACISRNRPLQVRSYDSPYDGHHCYGCKTTHPPISDWFGAQFFTCNDFYGNHLSFWTMPNRSFDFSLSVPRELVCRILHSHTTAFAHDFPVEQLLPRVKLTSQWNNIQAIKRWNARIVMNQLVLYSHTTLNYQGDPRRAGQYIDMGLVSICRHVNTGRLMFANHAPPQEHYFSRRHGSITSCPICSSDYTVDIVWNQGHLSLEISSYHIIDTAQPPKEWTWDVMSYCPEEACKSPRFRNLLRIPQGLAVHMWYKQHLEDLDRRPEGEWAVQPAHHRDRHYVNRPVQII
ncbi:hypothetical protein V8C35DRAFT_284695 [Trichoderma chlorosporum]